MEFSDALKLLQPALPKKVAAKWADLGSGEGLFTTALSHLIAEGSVIYAVDSNASALKKIKIDKKVALITIAANFEQDQLPLRDLDGILMANALHFVKEKLPFIQKIQTYLKPSGKLLLIEYDTDAPNKWVPFPISYSSCQHLFFELGYTVEKIGEQGSVYNSAGMYAAVTQVRPLEYG